MSNLVVTIDVNESEISNIEEINIVLGYRDNDYIMKYCSDDRVTFREYVVS